MLLGFWPVTRAIAQAKLEPSARTTAGSTDQGSLKHAKVYRDENLSPLPLKGVSVVAEETSSSSVSRATSEAGTEPATKSAQKSEAAREKEWRCRARDLQDRMAAIDAQIARVRENITNAAGRGYGIHLDTLNLSLSDLLDGKAGLQKQIDALAEEARKSGAYPGWLR
jgi:hypothetical protein